MSFSRFIGFLSFYITKPLPDVIYPPEAETPMESFMKLILFHLNFKSALQRFAISLVLNEWANCGKVNYYNYFAYIACYTKLNILS